MNKKIIISSMILMSSTVFAQTKIPTNKDLVKPSSSSSININQNNPIEQKINTPSATGGASYNESVVTGLDEYNQRKRALNEKAEYIKFESQKQLESDYRRAAYLSALRSAQAREKEKMSKFSSSKSESNSNQDYFDRQTKILSGQ